jgi:hypothetical protein
MKNSPEHGFNDEFEKRIASFSEMPDDVVWESIDRALRPNRILILMAWWDRVSTLVLVSVLLGATLNQSQNDSRQAEHSHRVMNKPAIALPERLPADSKMAKVPKSISAHPEVGNNRHRSGKTLNLSFSSTVAGASADANHLFDSSTIQRRSAGKLRSLIPTEMIIKLPPLDSVLRGEFRESTANDKSAENESSKKLSFKTVKFYVASTPMLNFYQIIPIARDGVGITGFESPSVLSADRLSVSLSAGLQGYISPRFEYYGGVTYFHKNTSIRYSFLSEAIVTELNSGLVYSIKPEHSVSEFNYRTKNLGVQGGMLFLLYGKKMMHKVGAGLLYYKSFDGSGNEQMHTNNRSSYLSYQLFYRNEIVINRRLKFFVQPTFTNSFYVDEKLKGRPFKLKPYSAGIGFGALFQLH